VKSNHIVLLTLLFVAATLGAWLVGNRGASWEELDTVSGVFVNVAVLAGAVAAMVKFHLFNLFGHRWRSDLECKHFELPDGDVVFTADYTITNTGQRPLFLSKVTIRLLPAVRDGVQVKADLENCLAERVMNPTQSTLKGLFQVEPGERAIFPLRCILPSLDSVVFVQCGFELPHRRVPAAFLGFYVKVPPVQANKPPSVGGPASLPQPGG
jgi:hypothetical protein